ncbi:DALR domain-containing protein, partial [Leuconostoc falkenbergense]|uniref:DALR domain-containing protein n=1 Tax=Leuconostoc falkenbergense TaxID=2766470 RepID=UPI0028A60A38
LGNFTTLHDMLANYDDPMTIRYLLATTQYRRPINYAEETLAQARAELDRIRTGYRNLEFRLTSSISGHDDVIDQEVNRQQQAFETAMDDDFNAQNAIAAVFELVTLANTYAESDTVKQSSANQLLETLQMLMQIFGVDIVETQTSLNPEQKQLFDDRANARKSHDFQKSDQLRDELNAQGIIVEDTPQGQRWHKA